MILATDLAKHFAMLGIFRSRLNMQNDIQLEVEDDMQMVLHMILKCSDIGHSAKPNDLH